MLIAEFVNELIELDVYKAYLVNFKKASKRRHLLLLNNRKYADVVQAAQSDPRCLGLDLESLLIEPIDRIPRYRMLLEKILECTPETHADFPHVSASLQGVCTLAENHNAAIKIRDNQDQLTDVMSEMEFRTRVNLLDDPMRRFIRSGPLLRQCRKGKKEFMFWLCSDKLIYGEAIPVAGALVSAQYMVNRDIRLSDCRVGACDDSGKKLSFGAGSGSIYTSSAFVVESPSKSFIVWATYVIRLSIVDYFTMFFALV